MELRTMLVCGHEGALIIKGGFRAEVGSDY
jgi:hypothetical protein